MTQLMLGIPEGAGVPDLTFISQAARDHQVQIIIDFHMEDIGHHLTGGLFERRKQVALLDGLV